MKYFFLSFVFRQNKTIKTVNTFTVFRWFPTMKDCKDALLAEVPNATNIVVAGITKLSKKEYETLKSEV